MWQYAYLGTMKYATTASFHYVSTHDYDQVSTSSNAAYIHWNKIKNISGIVPRFSHVN